MLVLLVNCQCPRIEEIDPPFPKGTPASVVEQSTGSKLRSELVEFISKQTEEVRLRQTAAS